MTVRVVYSRRAAAEVAEIAAYLAEHSTAAAQRFESIRKRAERQLSEFPNSGTPGPVPGARRLVAEDYIISY